MQNKEIEMDKTPGLNEENSFSFHGHDPDYLRKKIENAFLTISAQQVSKITIIYFLHYFYVLQMLPRLLLLMVQKKVYLALILFVLERQQVQRCLLF